jgi:hypothetical protein
MIVYPYNMIVWHYKMNCGNSYCRCSFHPQQQVLGFNLDPSRVLYSSLWTGDLAQ